MKGAARRAAGSRCSRRNYRRSHRRGGKPARDGWRRRGRRAAPAPGHSPFRAVAMGSQMPRTLRGEVGAIAMGSAGDFDVKQGMAGMGGGANARGGFESLYEQGVKDILHGTGRETFEAVKMLKAAKLERFQPQNSAQ